MKIISLNTWGGQVYEPLKNFIAKHSTDIDVFCFQEVNNGADPAKIDVGTRTNLFKELEEILPEHDGFFTMQVQGIGMAMFIKKNLPVGPIEEFVVLRGEEISRLRSSDGINYYPRTMQLAKINGVNIYNFHGVPGGGKLDCPERDLQTKELLKIFEKDDGTRIVIGDFNLKPDTQAVKLIGQNMQDLINLNNIKTTRTVHYKYADVQPHADFAFVSNNIDVKNFEVLNDVVSDHLPLLLEI